MRRERFCLPNPVVIVLFFACTGGAFWAVVRSSGEGCGWTNGLMWGLAWYYLSGACGQRRQRAYGSGWVVLAMVVGMYFGGMHGYGQFHSWITGVFHLESKTDRSVPISPMLGFWWNFLCGLGWGGVASVFLAWAGAARPHRWGEWTARIVLVIGMAWVFRAVAIARPEWIMPLYDRVDYLNASACPDCARTTRTLLESMMWLGFYVGGIAFEILRCNWRNLAFLLTMGVGFAIAFTAFEWLHLLPNLATGKVGWWKYWETSVGMLGGATLGICFLLYNRPTAAVAAAGEVWPGGGAYPQAEQLIGVWIPLLLSAYKVIENEFPRYAVFFGAEREPLAGVAQYIGWLVILPIGALALVKTWRAGEEERDAGVSPWLFAVPYMLMFLLAFLPQFGKLQVWENPLYVLQLLVYCLLFLIGLLSFIWIHCQEDSPSNSGTHSSELVR